MKVFIDFKPDKRKNLLNLFVTGLLFWFSITSLLPVLPLYIQAVGGTKQQIGLVMGCFAIGLLLTRSWLGALADRRGRKIIILIGTIVVAIAPLGYLLVNSIPLLMVLRAFHGISIAAFTTGYSALVVDISPVKQRGELIGYMSLAIPIGMAIGPACGGYIQAEFGYTILFLISTFAGLIALLCAQQVREELEISSEINQEKNYLGKSRTFWQLMTTPALFIPGIILLLIGCLFGTLATFLPLYIQDYKIDFNAGLFYGIAAIASFISRIAVGKSSDTIGRGLFITGSLICYGAAMILLALAKSDVVFTVAAILEGTGGGILIPMMIALMSDRSLASERGKVYAVCIGGFDLGVAIAGPIFGYLAFAVNYPTMFFLAGTLAIVGLVIFLTLSNGNFAYSLRFAFGREKDIYAVDS